MCTDTRQQQHTQNHSLLSGRDLVSITCSCSKWDYCPCWAKFTSEDRPPASLGSLLQHDTAALPKASPHVPPQPHKLQLQQ